MMHLRRMAPIACAIISLFVVSESSFSQGKSDSAPGRMYGLGQPRNIDELPSGQLRRSIENLPLQARGKAMKWLQDFSFPEQDLESLRVGSDGSVHYADVFEASKEESTLAEFPSTASMLDEQEVFSLHSRPGSSNVLFLDFDGHILDGTAWSSRTLVALPFDPSANDDPPTEAHFTSEEINTIHEIWHRISEDFAPFDIDVTTEEPAEFTRTTGRLLFTSHIDAHGYAMPSSTAGGIAYVNVFGHSEYVTRYSPALVYYTNLSARSLGLLNYNAEAGSHEFGHNLGLGHDGLTDGTEYYSGHGDGLVSWGPIMGNMLDKNVTQWSKGEYAGANNDQDDLAWLEVHLRYAPDDHGGSQSSATALRIEENGDVLASNPEVDPNNLYPENKGVINNRDDVDWFYFDVQGPGTVTLTATPAWHAFYRDSARGANIDIELTLLDSDLVEVGYDEPETDTAATVTSQVSAGRYYLKIDSIGNQSLSEYSDYASLGQYFIEGEVNAPVAAPDEDTTAPLPSTMGWQTAPTALDDSSITMTAVEAVDDSGPVEYLFTCVAGGSGCVDSGWQTDRVYTAGGLSADTYYAFKVRARDMFGNQGNDSPSMGDSTEVTQVTTNLAPEAIASYSPEPAVITRGKTVEVTLDGSASSDPDGFIVSWSWRDVDGAILADEPEIAIKLPEGDHQFTLTVTDDKNLSASKTILVSIATGAGEKRCNPKKSTCT